LVGGWRLKDDWHDTDVHVFTTDRLARYIRNQQPRLQRGEIEPRRLPSRTFRERLAPIPIHAVDVIIGEQNGAPGGRALPGLTFASKSTGLTSRVSNYGAREKNNRKRLTIVQKSSRQSVIAVAVAQGLLRAHDE
jgi:hypothetical protein